MKIIIAPDKFKGTLSARDVALAMERGVRRAHPNSTIALVPMADGGEGTIDALLSAMGGRRHTAHVTGPLGETVKADFAVLDNGTAVIEMAQASGFFLVPPDERDPTITTTFGTGELIEAALDLGCRRFLIGIGGSATCDAGIGAAQALDIKIVRSDGHPVGFGGRALVEVAHIDTTTADPRIKDIAVVVASDVNNPLYGPLGAAHMFAPQKGATPDQVLLLDQGLIHFAHVIIRDLGIDVANIPGAGAAGGLGAGLAAFLGAHIRLGVELVIEATGLRDKVKGADLVITGEGRFDAQSAHGKAPIGVARVARALGVKTVIVAGSLGKGYEGVLQEGIGQIYALTEIAGSAEEAMNNPASYIEETTYRAVKEVLL